VLFLKGAFAKVQGENRHICVVTWDGDQDIQGQASLVLEFAVEKPAFLLNFGIS
jgi:hypothetical protein